MNRRPEGVPEATLAAHALWLRSAGSDGERLDRPDADLRGADLRGVDLREALLPGADLSGADLRGADLCRAVLAGADLRDADLTGAHLVRTDLSGARARGARLRRATLVRTDLQGADLAGADLSRAHLVRTFLVAADLRGADLTEADLADVLVDRSTWGDLRVRDAAGTVVAVDGGVHVHEGGGTVSRSVEELAALVRAGGGRVTSRDPGEEPRRDHPAWRWADV